MKSSTPLFAGIFVLFFGMLGCEKEDINPSPIESILGDYDVTCCSWDTGKRLLISKKNDSVVEIRVLSDYPNNLRSLKYVYKELTIRKRGKAKKAFKNDARITLSFIKLIGIFNCISY